MQPFADVEDGFPDILERRFQFWLDGIWFDHHTATERRRVPGWRSRPWSTPLPLATLVFGACFHDWTPIAADERRVRWLPGFLAYAKEPVAVMTQTEYWRSVVIGG